MSAENTEKSQNLKKNPFSTVECAIMKGNPIDDQYFKISMFFSLCVNV